MKLDQIHEIMIQMKKGKEEGERSEKKKVGRGEALVSLSV